MEIASVEHLQVMDTQLDESLICPKSMQQQHEKKPRTQPEQSSKCPRCDSTNTKFCYYNNYSLSQPRYFCKGCRRYWTKGGSLRNVPVGGGCRKNNKRSSSSSNSSSSSSSSKKSQDQELTINNSNIFSSLPALPLPPLSFDPNDLTLAFASLQNKTSIENNDNTFMLGNLNPSTNTGNATGFLDILRSGFVDNTTDGSYNQSLYYGYGGNVAHNGNVEEVEGGDAGHMMFPFGGGLLNSINNSTQGAVMANNDSKVMDNVVDGHNGTEGKLHQWPIVGDHGNLGVVDSTRDYWSNGIGSSWHGLINSSLM